MAVLETTVTSKTRENKKKLPKNDNKGVKKVLVVAQELKLARVLAGNNKTARDRALKSLKKWFRNRSTTIPFTEDDFLRLWKGLFYSMWMSDKPLIQEECAENIASLVHVLPLDSSLLFYKCGMTILMNEWFGIDQLRLDKFAMFVRRLLRQILFVLKNENWTRNATNKFTNCLSETILNPEKQKPMGLMMHFIEIYLEELAKVSGGELPPQLVTEFVAPFIKELAFSDDSRIIDHIKKHVFIYLIRQSDLGLEYDEKYKAWRSLGFPGSIDAMKKVEEVEDEEYKIEEGEENHALDPRAGRVDVNLPQIKFHGRAIAKALLEPKFVKGTNSKSRKCLNGLAEHFKKLASGIYPLGVKKVKLVTDDYDTNIRKAVNRLVKFDQKIKGKKSKKRKLENDVIELRGGKKIKIDETLRQQFQEQIQNDFDKKKKRKTESVPESPPEKVAKTQPLLQIESIFRRNSGTWLVTKTVQQDGNSSSEIDYESETTDEDEEKVLYPKNKWESFGSEIEIDRRIERRRKRESEKEEQETTEEFYVSEPKIMYPKNKWEDSETDTKIAEMKVKGKALCPKNEWEVEEDTSNQLTKQLKKKRMSLPAHLIKNPFANSTPTKKVKINTSLNQSQEFQEHHAQVLSSPAIPYDANKKPSKPLLKTPTMKSPINPFYAL